MIIMGRCQIETKRERSLGFGGPPLKTIAIVWLLSVRPGRLPLVYSVAHDH